MGNYSTKIRVRLSDTDAAGILFFAHQFTLIHDAFEQFLTSIGFPIHNFFKKEVPFHPVIVHAEANYLAPITVGDLLTITLTIEKLGTTSLTIAYSLHNEETLVGRAKTVHVTIDKTSRQKTPLPSSFRQALNL